MELLYADVEIDVGGVISYVTCRTSPSHASHICPKQALPTCMWNESHRVCVYRFHGPSPPFLLDMCVRYHTNDTEVLDTTVGPKQSMSIARPRRGSVSVPPPLLVNQNKCGIGLQFPRKWPINSWGVQSRARGNHKHFSRGVGGVFLSAVRIFPRRLPSTATRELEGGRQLTWRASTTFLPSVSRVGTHCCRG